MMTIVFVCGDPVVNISILKFVVLQRHIAPTAGVMVWGAIACNTKSFLVLIRGTMTAQGYVHDIQQPHVLPLMQRLPGAIFQQDNAQPHTARVSQDTVTTLSWPAQTSDLSPIEHIWDHLGWRVGHPTSLNELEERSKEICSKRQGATLKAIKPQSFRKVGGRGREVGGLLPPQGVHPQNWGGAEQNRTVT
ncbi:transposable element Tcb2 transposase [Trichonephila clavipes]|nr:transposable element Tcb2 transposase [Trichonephila clavipes]